MTETNYKFHVFLSHNGAQKDWTRRLAESLREHGLSVFFDEDSIQLGEDIPRAIENGLKSSRHIVLVLSPEALASDWVALEYSASLYKDPGSAARVLLPVLRSDCDVPLILARLKYLDARGNDFDRQVAHLLNGIDRVQIEGSTEPSSPLARTQPSREIPDLFTLGGPVRSEGIYVERQADLEVRRHLERYHLVVITGPRRIGKTSLLNRTCQIAKASGRPVARVDLQMFAGGTSMPQLYYFLAKELSNLGQVTSPDAVQFLERPSTAFLRVLRHLPPKTLLAIDEFDALRGINGLEEFASVLRAFWNQCAVEEQDISMLIAGVLEPTLYIQNPVVSPFNVGIHFRLGGFTRSEADRLLNR
jgi:hypothetical protein